MLNNHYYNLSYPTAFTGAQNIYQTLKRKNYKVTLGQVKQFLLHQTTYLLHRRSKNNFNRRKTLNSFLKPGFVIFADIWVLNKFKQENDGHGYVLLFIGMFVCVYCYL